jgi:hypothetical protein
MDLQLFEQWFLSILPENYHVHMHPLFRCIRENPHLQLIEGLPVFTQHLYKGTDVERAAVINGFLLGITAGEAYRRSPTEVSSGMRLAIDVCNKKNGKNVVNFMQERAKR